MFFENLEITFWDSLKTHRPAQTLWKSGNFRKYLIHVILSKDIDVQRILQSDSTRGTTGHTQPQVVVSDPIR